MRNFTMLVDDTDIFQYGMLLVDYETPTYIGRKTTGLDLPGAHGTQSVSSALSSSSFSVNLVCSGDTPEEVHARIRLFLAFMYSTQDPHKIVFTDDLNSVRYAILDSPDRHQVVKGIDGSMAELKLTFYMLDPFVYDSEQEVFTATLENGTDVYLTNEGYECPAIFTLQNTENTLVTGIHFFVNDEAAYLDLCSLKKGDIITLDTINFKVKLNDEENLSYWHGDMPRLINGKNTISMVNDGKLNVDLTVKFFKRWIS